MEFLLSELTGKRPLLPPNLPMNAEVAGELPPRPPACLLVVSCCVARCAGLPRPPTHPPAPTPTPIPTPTHPRTRPHPPPARARTQT